MTTYGVVLYGGQKMRTNKVINSSNPIYDNIEFVLDIFNSQEQARLQVWEYNSVLNDELVGEAVLKLENIIKRENVVDIKEWIPLKKRTALSSFKDNGEIYVSIRYEPNFSTGFDSDGWDDSF